MNGHANPPPERMIAHADMDAFYASARQFESTIESIRVWVKQAEQ